MKRIPILLLLVSCCINLQAQITDTINKHMIIAIDRFPDKGNGYQSILESNPQLIINSISKLSKDIGMAKSDYVSIVIFSIGTNDSSLDKYATCGVINGRKLLWNKYTSLKDLFGDRNKSWSAIINSHVNEGSPFSMLTGAQMYSLKACGNDKYLANKTYLLMVTDNQYNGNGDVDAEFVHFMQQGASRNLKREDFRNTCISISKDYNFIYLSEEIIKDHNMYPYKVTLFEVRPSSSFSLNSVVNYPANLGLQRIRGGYKISFEYQLTSDKYNLSRFDVEIHHANNNQKEIISNYDGNSIETKVSSSVISDDSIKVTLKGWLHKKDETYNSAMLNPNDPVFSNLSITQTLPIRDEYKIFGLFPLKDLFWWWYPNDLHAAVVIWEIVLSPIILLLILGIGYYALLKTTKYIPEDKSIKITHL